jgi:hypothetical protein
MADLNDNEQKANREYAQLLRLHERLLSQLDRTLSELGSAATTQLLKAIRARTGSAPDLSDIVASVEEAIRGLKMGESQMRKSLFDEHGFLSVDGVPNLPAHLQRFLAERTQMPGFSYEVIQDEVRGWVICWKEYTHRGTIRGYGQFYERPYAWLDD